MDVKYIKIYIYKLTRSPFSQVLSRENGSPFDVNFDELDLDAIFTELKQWNEKGNFQKNTNNLVHNFYFQK